MDIVQLNNLNTIKINNFNITCGHERAMKELYTSIFDERIYDFKTTNIAPNIIDAGSNIGIASLFFKNKYPLAKILCFEPDPYNFAILQKNIIINNLKNVITIQAALAKKAGFTSFYGEIGDFADTRGNSINKLWGEQRNTTKSIIVKTVKLSSYINNEIDLLKMDIEGAEQQVLEDLTEKLYLIKALIIEVHEAQNVCFNNNLQTICTVLQNNNFNITVQPSDNLQHSPKETIARWVEKVKPKLSIVKAERK
ncbi:MAG: FkbM family methyltransferase [Gammaproteobacteria bacterium]|jgi:FkbM family methyltransferase